DDDSSDDVEFISRSLVRHREAHLRGQNHARKRGACSGDGVGCGSDARKRDAAKPRCSLIAAQSMDGSSNRGSSLQQPRCGKEGGKDQDRDGNEPEMPPTERKKARIVRYIYVVLVRYD